MAEEAPISKIQLSVIEKSLDKLFSKLGIDIAFTKHFFEKIYCGFRSSTIFKNCRNNG